MAQRKWIDIEMKRSKDPYCFQMSKIRTQLLRPKEVGREEDAGVLCSRIVDKCKEVLSDDSRPWSDEMKEKLALAPCWSADKCMDVLAKGGGEKKRFQFFSKPNCPEKTPVPLSHSRSVRKSFFWKCSYQSCIARQCAVTEGFYQVYLSRRKWRGNEINSA